MQPIRKEAPGGLARVVVAPYMEEVRGGRSDVWCGSREEGDEDRGEEGEGGVRRGMSAGLAIRSVSSAVFGLSRVLGWYVDMQNLPRVDEFEPALARQPWVRRGSKVQRGLIVRRPHLTVSLLDPICAR